MDARTSSPTVGQALEDWMTARAVLKPSVHTSAAYRRDIRMIAGLLAADLQREGDPLDVVLISDLTVRSLRAAFARFAADHEKSSIARAQSTWRGLCSFAVAEEWLTGDPMSGLERVHAPRREPKPLRGDAETAGDLLVFLGAEGRGGRNPWPERDIAVVATLLLTGLRSGEIRSLMCGDMFGGAGERRLRVRGKGDKERSVPLEPALERLLESYQQTRQSRFPDWKPSPTSALFVDAANRVLSRDQLRYLVSACFQAAGLGSSFPTGARVHALRHTFATLLADSGATASEIMDLMGHGSLNTSQSYIKASTREVRRSAAANPLYQSLPRD